MGDFLLTASSDSSRDSKRFTFTLCLSVIAAITACAYSYYHYRASTTTTKDKMAQVASSKDNSSKEQTNPNSKYVKGNEKEEEKKEDNLQKSSSSYYLYKSTNPEEAKKYAPKKLDNQSAQSLENSVKSSSKGSSWNTGATMEQFDYSEWMNQRLEALLLSITFKNSQIRIVEVT